MGIEPTYPAWEAGVLPMNYIRITIISIAHRNGKGKLFFAGYRAKRRKTPRYKICRKISVGVERISVSVAASDTLPT